MKRRTVLGVVLILLLLSACGKKQEEKEHHHAADMELKMALSAKEDEPVYMAAEQFAKEVHTKTNGAIEIVLCGENQLGSEEEVVASVAENQVKADMVIADIDVFKQYAAEVDISKMPFLFSDYEDAREFMEGDIQRTAEHNLEHQNIRVLTHYAKGFHYLTLRGKPLRSVTDLQGEKIATSKQGIEDVGVKALGGMTMLYEIEQLPQTLRQGYCVGYEGTLETIYKNQLYQGQSYLNVTNHCFESSLFVISQSVWDELGEEYQSILKEAALSSAVLEYGLVHNQETEMIKKIESSGVRLQYPNSDMFWEKMESVVRNYSSVYENLAERVIQWRKK